ncbi:MAG: hypothetical protein LUD46_06835 [Parabacteroides sp.]|nr:hypothetical protein [Parabacteroides sp.]
MKANISTYPTALRLLAALFFFFFFTLPAAGQGGVTIRTYGTAVTFLSLKTKVAAMVTRKTALS